MVCNAVLIKYSVEGFSSLNKVHARGYLEWCRSDVH